VGVDDRPFEVEVHLTTGQIVLVPVDPKKIASMLGRFPDLSGRSDREAIRTAAFTLFAEAAAPDAPGDGLSVYDREGRTWVIPYRSIVAINFRDPVMPHEDRRAGFRPETEA